MPLRLPVNTQAYTYLRPTIGLGILLSSLGAGFGPFCWSRRDKFKRRNCLSSMQRDPALFVLTDAPSLREYYSTVESIDEFVSRAGQLNAAIPWPDNLPIVETALHRGLSAFFACRDPCNFRTFISSLIDSAEVGLNAYQRNGNCLNPTEFFEWEQNRLLCCGVLANAFLCNVAGDPIAGRTHNDGVLSGLKFQPFFFQSTPSCDGKVRCLIQYFMTTQKEAENRSSAPNETVTFRQISGLSMSSFRAMKAWNTSLSTSRRSRRGVIRAITTSAMESREASALVDFANQVYGVGRFYDSCTQEEIIQVCCPEFNVGMLVYGYMSDDTVVVAHNVRRYSTYTGYGNSFQYQGPILEPYTQSIIAMDASVTDDPLDQFLRAWIYRDVRKAFLGFLGCAMGPSSSGDLDADFLPNPTWKSDQATTVVSTGKWGCGAFGGDPVLKFLEQVIAAHLCGAPQVEGSAARPAVSLIFSSYRNAELKATLEQVYSACDGLTPQYILDNVLTRPHLFGGLGGKAGEGLYSAVIDTLNGAPR